MWGRERDVGERERCGGEREMWGIRIISIKVLKQRDKNGRGERGKTT